MDTQKQVLNLLDEVLSLGGRSAGFTLDTPLVGAIPEFDSMAVVSVITSIEERFDVIVDDDDVDGDTFATVGTLVGFIEGKLAG